jgi:hypothetical protein
MIFFLLAPPVQDSDGFHNSLLSMSFPFQRLLLLDTNAINVLPDKIIPVSLNIPQNIDDCV